MNDNKLNYFVTTSIPYVNDRPHLGHAYEFTIADVIARYRRQIGDNVLFSTGTDEHGGKIEEKAKQAGLTPKQFADNVSEQFKQSLQVLGISHDRFVRTTDQGHEQRVEVIWNTLAKNYIYKDKFVGWYCVGCESYKTDTQVKDTQGVCPDHNRPYDKLVEDNYFFKLSAFKSKLVEMLTGGQYNIVPKQYSKEALNILNDDLHDFSISRPRKSVDWGIAVPGDPDQVIYVWFEALMNYITVLGYPEYKDFNDYWPAATQVVGKDILRFHGVIWPAMLIGLGIDVYKDLYVHGHITANNTKMSKSLGNAIDPIEVVEKYGLDAFRYYIMRHIPSYGDGDFSFERFEIVYNSELANELGNSVSRVASMIQKYQEGVIGEVKTELHDPEEFYLAMGEYKFDRALEFIWTSLQELSKYLEFEKPWEIAKNDPEHLKEVLAYAASSLLEIAVLLEPFMPDTSRIITKTFGTGVLVPLAKPLFQRLEVKTSDVA